MLHNFSQKAKLNAKASLKKQKCNQAIIAAEIVPEVYT